MKCTRHVTTAVFPNGCGVVTLNRPARLNALSFDMICELWRVFRTWMIMDSVRFVVLQSAFERSFCSGGDMKQLAHSVLFELHFQPWQFLFTEYRLDYLLCHYPKPVIAVANGIVMGGGAGLALNCAVTLSTEKTQFAMPEAKARLIPDVLVPYHLAQCGGGMGVYLGMTGSMIGGSLMRDLGLAQCSLHSSLLPRLLNILTVDRSLMDGLSYSTGYDRSEFTRRMQEMCQYLSRESTGSFTLSESHSDILLRSDPIRSLIQECFSLDKPAVFAYQRLSQLIKSDQIEESTLEWCKRTLVFLKSGCYMSAFLFHRLLQRIRDLKCESEFQKSAMVSNWLFHSVVRHMVPLYFPLGVFQNVFGKMTNPENIEANNYRLDGIDITNAARILNVQTLDEWLDCPSDILFSFWKTQGKWIKMKPDPTIPPHLILDDVLIPNNNFSFDQCNQKVNSKL